MSNTFHGSEHIKPELIRRRVRKGKRNPEFEGAENITLGYILTKELIQRTQKSVQEGVSFISLCRKMIRAADYDTANLEYIENMGHPIFSASTEGKVNALLKYNPELTSTYFERTEDSTLKIGFSEIKPTKLTERRIEEIRVRLWGLLYALYPTREYIESAQYIQLYLKGIQASIVRTRIIIDIASATPIDDIEDPNTNN